MQISFMLWIVSFTCSSSNYISKAYFSVQFLIKLLVFVHQEVVAIVTLLFFQCFVYTFEKFILLIWNVLLNATKGGNIILKIYTIPVNFGLFKVLEKPLGIDSPVPLSVSNLLNVSHKPTYSSKTPSTDAYKLSHLVFTAFLLSFLRLLPIMLPYKLFTLCVVFK